MAESPKRPADVSRADASRVVKRGKPAAPTNETARAADSVPVAVGPFTVLPTQFGRYRIEKLLGKGAMGAVYLAHDIQLDRPVALKVARISTAGSAKLIKRMETEAKAAAKIDHPQICKVYDFGEIDGVRFIALQYIEGEDLKSYLKRVGGKRDPDEAVGWILRLAAALEAAHEKGVIHRDLKPENIMLDRKYEPVIMDFGLARSLTGATNAGLTQGMILGTAAYMSPEQAIGKAEGIDHRSDLYALGVMLFEMLTGEWPFTGSAIEVMGKKSVQEAPSPLSLSPNIPPQLAEICQKMIARKSEDRYTTCAEIIAALEAVDLQAPAALEMDVQSPEAPSPFEVQGVPSFNFLDGLPAAPSSNVATPIGRSSQPSPKRMSHALAVFRGWWRDQPTTFRWTILGASSVCLLLAMTLLFRSGDALVRVEIHADDVEVTFQNKTLTLSDGPHEYRIKPGEMTLHIKAGDVEFDTDKFTIKRGDNVAVSVDTSTSEIVAMLGEVEIGRKSLSTSIPDQSESNANRHSVENSLSEQLPVGAVLAGEYSRLGESTVLGDFTVTIVNRDGDKFKGRYFKRDRLPNAGGLTCTVDGEIDDTTIAFRGATATMRFSAKGSAVDGRLEMKFSTSLGGDFTMRSIIAKQISRNDTEIPGTQQLAFEQVGIKNGDFSDGIKGWTIEGGASAFRVFQMPQQQVMALTTFGTGNIDTGRIFQSFIVPPTADSLEFYVHGSSRQAVYVALSQDYRTINRVSGPNKQSAVRIEWSIKDLRGQKVLLEVSDYAQDGYGYIGVHGFRVIESSLPHP